MRVKSLKEIREETQPLNIYKLSFWVYVHTGFWPYDFPNQLKNNLFTIYKVCLTIIYIGALLCFVVDAYLVRQDLEKLSFNMSSSFLIYLTDIKMVLLKNKRVEFEEVLESLENHLYLKTIGKSPEDNKILFQKAKILLKISKLFYSALIFIYPLRIIANTALGSRSYMIPIPFSDILDPYYGWIYVPQVVLSTHFLVTVISHDMLIYGVIIRFIAHYEILQNNLGNIKKLYPRKDYRKHVPGYAESEEERNMVSDILICKMNGLDKIQILLKRYGFEKLNAINNHKRVDRVKKTSEILRECIRHHQKILKEINKFGLLYSEALLIQSCGTVLLIGIVALHIIFLSSQITILLAQQVLFVLTSLVNVYYLCTFGSEVTNRSEETANTLYDLPWYDMDMENRKTLLFVLKNLVKSPKIRGGGMVVINRETYLKLLQTSYNMVAVLKNGY